MVLALLADVAGLTVTGWAYTTDRFWGDASVGPGCRDVQRRQGLALRLMPIGNRSNRSSVLANGA